MNSTRSTLIGTAVAIALFGPNARAQSQQLEEIIVTGIRYSIEQSLETKRAATRSWRSSRPKTSARCPTRTSPIRCQRVPGVTTSSASANEGGFDENDRVSMRGTNPSLTQTLINGHNVAAGDWFVLNQVQQVGRSVSYTLLPSELVDQHRRAQELAGLARRRRRRRIGRHHHAHAARLPRPVDLQRIGRRGVRRSARRDRPAVQRTLQLEERRRATSASCCRPSTRNVTCAATASEMLGYETIAPGSAIALVEPRPRRRASTQRLIGAALFEQERKRTGGLIDLEFRPTDDLSFDLQYFMSDLEATNYNRNYLVWSGNFVAAGAGQAPDPGYVVRNNTLVAGQLLAGGRARTTAIYDQISRPDAEASSNYGSLDGDVRRQRDAERCPARSARPRATARRRRRTSRRPCAATGNGASWQLHGIGSAPDFNFGATNTSTPFPGGSPVGFGWIFGAQFVDVKDQEDWAQIDADFEIDRRRVDEPASSACATTSTRASRSTRSRRARLASTASSTDQLSDDVRRTTRPTSTRIGGSSRRTSGTGRRRSLRNTTATASCNRDPHRARVLPVLVRGRGEEHGGLRAGGLPGLATGAATSACAPSRTEEDVVTYTQTAADDPDAILGFAVRPVQGRPRRQHLQRRAAEREPEDGT